MPINNKTNDIYEVQLTDNTKITYKKEANDTCNIKKFIINTNINNEDNEIIIKFCETLCDYTIFVCINELNKNRLNENQWLMTELWIILILLISI